MKLNEVIKLLNAEVHHSRDDMLDLDIKTASASDLMSDILASVNVPDILLTGLTNAQVIRTSSVFGIKAVVFVRGKNVDQKVVDLAKEENIVIMTTKESLFESSGKLYKNGVVGATTSSS